MHSIVAVSNLAKRFIVHSINKVDIAWCDLYILELPVSMVAGPPLNSDSNVQFVGCVRRVIVKLSADGESSAEKECNDH